VYATRKSWLCPLAADTRPEGARSRVTNRSSAASLDGATTGDTLPGRDKDNAVTLLTQTVILRHLTGLDHDVLHDLSHLHAVAVELDGKVYLTRTELVGQVYEAFKAVGLRPPARVQPLLRPEAPLRWLA